MTDKPDIWTQEAKDALALLEAAARALAEGNLREVEVRLEKASLVVTARVRR